MNPQSDKQASDALRALAADQLTGEYGKDLLAQAGLSAEEAEELGGLVDALRYALRPQEPRGEFAETLRCELLGEPPGPFKRLRQMPARLHIAAVLALVAGALFMFRRLFASDATQEMQEEAVATPL